MHSVELTPDGKEILVAGFSGVYTIDVASGNAGRRYRKHERNVVWAARMTADGTRVVAGNGGKRLDVWDAQTTKRIFELETDDAIVSRLSLSYDGKRAVSAAGNTVLRFWDIEHGERLAGRVEKKSFVIAAAIAPIGGPPRMACVRRAAGTAARHSKVSFLRAPSSWSSRSRFGDAHAVITSSRARCRRADRPASGSPSCTSRRRTWLHR